MLLWLVQQRHTIKVMGWDKSGRLQCQQWLCWFTSLRLYQGKFDKSQGQGPGGQCQGHTPNAKTKDLTIKAKVKAKDQSQEQQHNTGIIYLARHRLLFLVLSASSPWSGTRWSTRVIAGSWTSRQRRGRRHLWTEANTVTKSALWDYRVPLAAASFHSRQAFTILSNGKLRSVWSDLRLRMSRQSLSSSIVVPVQLL